jgi:hypothetical protein
MTPQMRSLKFGRPAKRKRSDAELQALAHGFGADWTPGDTVQTWLHKHEGKAGELSRMVEEGWSWEDLGRAMHLAGISYRTGAPISANTLRHKAYLARNRERDRVAAEAARQAVHRNRLLTPSASTPDAAPELPAPARPNSSSGATNPVVLASAEAARSAPGEPIFHLVTLKGGQHAAKTPPQTPRPRQEQSAMAKVSDDEILRRVFGNPKP